MKGTEGIIEKILSDARAEAKKTKEVAEYDNSMAEKATQAWVEKYFKEQRSLLERESADVVERKLTLAKLDKRKLVLKAKQEVIDRVFLRALTILQSLKKEDYLKLVVKLISENADEGDKVVFSSDGVINQEDLKKSKVAEQKKLSFSKEKGKFIGGIMLIGASCDKDLTFATMLEENREQMVNKIATELFL